MERRTRDGAAAATTRPMTRQQFEAFYKEQFPRLVKILMMSRASLGEAEEAVQEAMLDFCRRSRARQAVSNPAAYVRKAASNFFVKARKRERERPARELQGGHLTPEGNLDDGLITLEQQEEVKRLLECLTPAQHKAAMAVLKAAFSESGYRKITAIVQAEEVLKNTSGSAAGPGPAAPASPAGPRRRGGRGR